MNNLTLIRWAGGKGRQLRDLLPLIPYSQTYVEPFGGGASVLLNRYRSEVEVYNDLDSALVNLFRVVRDENLFKDFMLRLDWIPYAKNEFEVACNTHDDPALGDVDRAVLFYTMLNQSISGKRLASKGDWARGRLDNLAERWKQRQDKLWYIHDRINSVQIENRDALEVIREWDSPATVFYCDPPYVLETRTNRKYYAVEPGDEWHIELVDLLLRVKGMVVLSGYHHILYKPLIAAGWVTDLYGAKATMEVVQQEGEKQKRTEVVYRNRRAADMGERRPLFSL